MLASIDLNLGAVDIRSAIGAKEMNERRHFFGLAEPVHWNVALDDILGAWGENRCIDFTWGDRIDPNPVLAIVIGHFASQGRQCGF